MNERFLKMLDHEIEDVVGKQLMMFVDGGDVPYVMRHLGQRKRGVEERYDVRFVRRDGTKVLTMINASPIFDDGQKYCGSMSLVTDVTDIRRMENALKEEKERLSVTLRSIGDGVIVTDNDGNIVLMNGVAEELTGWQQGEAVSRPLEDVFNIVNEVTRKRCENPAEKVLRLGRIIGLANHTILISRNGTERVLGDSGAPIRDDKGTIMGVVLVFRDVTNDQKMEAEMVKMQRLESIGVLAGGIAHDFNNYLTAIDGNIALVKIKMDPRNTTVLERLSDAENASKKARALTKQLLVFSKGGEPIKKTIQVEMLLLDSLKIALAGSNVKYRLEVEPGLWPIEADEGQIGQVINNIVINAKDAMPHGGAIDICVKNHGSTGDVSSCDKGGYISISIKDNGVGIPANIMDKIFDPYFTTKQDGRGLGLAIVHSIIMHHDGKMLVSSEQGKGTTFTILLPVSYSDREIREERKEEEISGHGRILWMDDEEMIREVGGELLSYLGYQVEFAEDGKEAIEKYTASMNTAGQFDLVILDLTVPGGIGGEETIRRLLERDPNIDAIVCSGYSNDHLMSHYYDYGFKGVVPKPFSIEDLGSTLRKVLERKADRIDNKVD